MYGLSRNKSSSPPVRNSFQRELESKVRDRRARGLAADISDEELDSDDGGYNFMVFQNHFLS